MIEDLKATDGVEDAYYKSKKKAMKEFKERWGENGYLLDSLEGNPLPNSVVIIIGDLLATGGTAKAATHLIEKVGGTVECCVFIIELMDLKGRDVLKGYRVESLTKF